jgi:Putative prokaryotic signal transducing protein
MSDISAAASYTSTFDAEIAVAHLASLGITAHLTSDDAGGAFPSMSGLGSGARVMVRTEDLAAAQQALADLDDDSA